MRRNPELVCALDGATSTLADACEGDATTWKSPVPSTSGPRSVGGLPAIGASDTDAEDEVAATCGTEDAV